MRIAIVSDYFPDFVGGAQTSMGEQKRAITDAGHRVFMVNPVRRLRGAFTRSGDTLGVHPLLILPGVALPVIRNTPRIVDVLVRFFRDNGIDTVHVQSEFGLAHAAAAAAERLGIRVVHTVHTFYWLSQSQWHAPLAGLIRSLLQRFIGISLPARKLVNRPVDNVLRNLTLGMSLRADAVVSPSAHQARDLEAAGVTTPVAVVPNPVGASGTPPRLLTAEQAASPRFLWVARCEAVKRPLVFAEAAILALQRVPGAFSVDFVGDGFQLRALRRLAAGHPELRVHGSLPHATVLGIMDDSAAVVLNSVGFDNQPMTIAEAVTRWRGVLYCDPKLTEGLANAGYLAETPDVAGLADALVTLATKPELLLAMSRGAGADASEFSAETFVDRILEVYRGTRPN